MSATLMIEMLVAASATYGEDVSKYFYILEHELPLYINTEEVVTYKGRLVKLSTLRVVKLYDPTTRRFR